MTPLKPPSFLSGTLRVYDVSVYTAGSWSVATTDPSYLHT